MSKRFQQCLLGFCEYLEGSKMCATLAQYYQDLENGKPVLLQPYDMCFHALSDQLFCFEEGWRKAFNSDEERGSCGSKACSASESVQPFSPAVPATSVHTG